MVLIIQQSYITSVPVFVCGSVLVCHVCVCVCVCVCACVCVCVCVCICESSTSSSGSTVIWLLDQ